jgi:hypothetical protein
MLSATHLLTNACLCSTRAGLSSLTHGSLPVWPLGGGIGAASAQPSGAGGGAAGPGGSHEDAVAGIALGIPAIDPGASSLARQVGSVMPCSSAAFLLGAGAPTDPESALLLDTNIQVRPLLPD